MEHENVILSLYAGQEEEMKKLIYDFWKEHNGSDTPPEILEEDLKLWTEEGSRLYFAKYEDKFIGFLRLGSRGNTPDWIEDIFIIPEFQGRGFGSELIRQAEKIVKEYSISIYIEASARNNRAIKLYKNLGFDCLNTLTLRKDFNPQDFEVMSEESVSGNKFEIKNFKNR